MPDIKFQDGSTLRTMRDIYYQDGATLRHITSAYYQDGATLRKVWPSYVPMTGSMANVNGDTSASLTNDIVGVATMSVSGGNASKTYTFTKLSGVTTAFNISSSGKNCTITRVGKPPRNSTATMTLQCVCDDGTSTLTKTCTVYDARSEI